MKLFWLYLCDQCDNAGVWLVNWRLAGFHVALPTHEKITAQLVADGRVVVFAEGKKWFIPRFLTFQYPTGLVEKCPPHKRIITTLLAHGIDPVSRVVGTLPTRVVTTLVEEEEEVEVEEDVFKGGAGGKPIEIPPAALAVTPMPRSFTDWQVAHGRVFVGREDRGDWEALFRKAGYEIMSQVHSALLPKLERGKSIFFTTMRDYIAEHCEDTP